MSVGELLYRRPSTTTPQIELELCLTDIYNGKVCPFNQCYCNRVSYRIKVILVCTTTANQFQSL